MSEDSSISDVRKVEEYKGVTFSGYKKTSAVKELMESMRQGKIEPACHWSAELVCSGHLMDLWETIIGCAAKHIHVANPLLYPYLELRLTNFKELVRNGYSGNELMMRNNHNVRKLFAEIMCVLCQSRKSHAIQHIKIDKSQFDITHMSGKLKAPDMNYARSIHKDGDPKELFVPLNECAYHVSRASKDNMMACYWVEWIIEFDAACRTKKEPCLANRRNSGIVGEKHEKDVIWLLWEAFIREAETRKNATLVKILRSLLALFALRYTAGAKKRRRFLLYLAVSLLTTAADLKTRIYHDRREIDAVIGRIDTVYRQIKKNEHSPATGYLMHGLGEASSIDKTASKLEALSTLGLMGTRK